MKVILISLILLIFNSIESSAQKAEGNILINGKSKFTTERAPSIVHHFADFKTGKNKIVFNLKTAGYPKMEDGKEVAIVAFETIVKVNGREVSKSTSKPLPFFPGEMTVPIESFEVIQQIFMDQYGLNKSPRENPYLEPKRSKGTTYEIELKADLMTGQGEIAPAYLVIII